MRLFHYQIVSMSTLLNYLEHSLTIQIKMFYPCQQIVDQRFIWYPVLVICLQIVEQIGLKAI